MSACDLMADEGEFGTEGMDWPPKPALDDLAPRLNSTQDSEVIQVLQGVQSLFLDESTATEELIRRLTALHLVPRFLALASSPHEQISFEALGVLANFSTGQPVQQLVDNNIVPLALAKLESPHLPSREQALALLARIAGESAQLRDYLLQHDALGCILRVFTATGTTLPLTRAATLAVANICHRRPDYAKVKQAIPVAIRLCFSTDKEIQHDATSILKDLTEKRVDEHDTIAASLARPLTAMLTDTDAKLLRQVLGLVANVTATVDSARDKFLEAHVLQPIPTLFQHRNREVVRLAIRVVRHIFNGAVVHVQKVLEARLLPKLFELATNDDVKDEAALCMAAAVEGGSSSQVIEMVSCGMIEALASTLSWVGGHAPETTLAVLQAIQRILDIGNKKMLTQKLDMNPYTEMVERANGIEHIEMLQMSDSTEVYECAIRILEKFFCGLEVADFDMQAPQ